MKSVWSPEDRVLVFEGMREGREAHEESGERAWTACGQGHLRGRAGNGGRQNSVSGCRSHTRAVPQAARAAPSVLSHSEAVGAHAWRRLSAVCCRGACGAGGPVDGAKRAHPCLRGVPRVLQCRRLRSSLSPLWPDSCLSFFLPLFFWMVVRVAQACHNAPKEGRGRGTPRSVVPWQVLQVCK